MHRRYDRDRRVNMIFAAPVSTREDWTLGEPYIVVSPGHILILNALDHFDDTAACY
jgi:hypothetical protein